MDVVALAVVLISALLAGVVYWGSSRAGAGAVVAFAAGLVTYAVLSVLLADLAR